MHPRHFKDAFEMQYSNHFWTSEPHMASLLVVGTAIHCNHVGRTTKTENQKQPKIKAVVYELQAKQMLIRVHNPRFYEYRHSLLRAVTIRFIPCTCTVLKISFAPLCPPQWPPSCPSEQYKRLSGPEICPQLIKDASICL